MDIWNAWRCIWVPGGGVGWVGGGGGGEFPPSYVLRSLLKGGSE